MWVIRSLIGPVTKPAVTVVARRKGEKKRGEEKTSGVFSDVNDLKRLPTFFLLFHSTLPAQVDQDGAWDGLSGGRVSPGYPGGGSRPGK